MKTFICKHPFQAYNTALNKYTTIHTGACFVSLSDGQPNNDCMLLLFGITADDDKKMWIAEKVFKEYFEETTTDAALQSGYKPPLHGQTVYEALYL